MRHPILPFLCVTGALALAACQKPAGDEVDRALRDINVVDETGLSDVMLTAADPDEAVAKASLPPRDSPARSPSPRRGSPCRRARGRRGTW